MIKYHGDVSIPQIVIEHADTIKLENYKTNTPAKFQVRTLVGGEELMDSLSKIVGIEKKNLLRLFNRKRVVDEHRQVGRADAVLFRRQVHREVCAEILVLNQLRAR